MNGVSNSSPLIIREIRYAVLAGEIIWKDYYPQAVYKEVVAKGSEKEHKNVFHVEILIKQGIIHVENLDIQIEAIIYASRTQ